MTWCWSMPYARVGVGVLKGLIKSYCHCCYVQQRMRSQTHRLSYTLTMQIMQQNVTAVHADNAPPFGAFNHHKAIELHIALSAE